MRLQIPKAVAAFFLQMCQFCLTLFNKKFCFSLDCAPEKNLIPGVANSVLHKAQFVQKSPAFIMGIEVLEIL